MKVNILNIPEEGLNLQYSLKGDSLPDPVPEGGSPDFSLRFVAVSGFVRKAHQSIFFTGTMETVMEMPCDRCLEIVHLPIKASFNYTLLPEVNAGKEEVELKTEDLEVGYYSGEVIDLDPIIFEQIFLQVPMKVLCKESCKGLCPRCGINLNTETCGCRSDFIDERLAVLKNFKV